MDDPATQPPPPSLRELVARGPLALFLDFDGTLVEIAAEPGAIAVEPGLAEKLTTLSERLEGRLALISGRAIDNLEQHCGALAIACAGSHGAEVRNSDGTAISRQDALPQAAVNGARAWAEARDIMIEAKPYGIALHSRSKPKLEEDCAIYLTELAERHGLAVKRGKKVAELVQPGADKGRAVRDLMDLEPFAGAFPVFVGDDVTDEDGFAACAALGGFGIAVGERPSRVARYRLDGPAAVRNWMRL